MKLKRMEIIPDKIGIKFLIELSFSFFLTSLIVGDIYQESIQLIKFGQYLRYISYMLSVIALLMDNKHNSCKLIVTVILLILGIVFYIFTDDIYILMIVLLSYECRRLDEDTIFKTYLSLLSTISVLVLLLTLLGLLPDNMTARAFSTDLTRHSFGFYHSDVLPGIVVYLQIYYVWLYKRNINIGLLLLFMLLNLILFKYCHSRVCLIVGTIYSVTAIYMAKRRKTNYKAVNLLAKNIGLICGLSSLVGMCYIGRKPWIYQIDYYLSNRLYFAYQKMMVVGLKPINLLTNEMYYKSEFVVDNGYLFIALRYGYLILILLLAVNIIVNKGDRKDSFVNISIIAVFAMGLIDNDFLSYGFLPILTCSFITKPSRKDLKKGLSAII